MKRWKIAAGVALTAAATMWPGVSAQAGEAGIQGVGWQMTPMWDTAMYSAPGLSTPRIGTAWAGDNVAVACQMKDSNGKRLVLGIDRPGRDGVQWANTAGYIWGDHIREVTDNLPGCTGFWTLRAVRETGMYSGPGLSTPRVGKVWANGGFTGICKINDSNGRRMVLGVEHSGLDGVQWAKTAGYIPDSDISGTTDHVVDCGTS